MGAITPYLSRGSNGLGRRERKQLLGGQEEDRIQLHLELQQVNKREDSGDQKVVIL